MGVIINVKHLVTLEKNVKHLRKCEVYRNLKIKKETASVIVELIILRLK